MTRNEDRDDQSVPNDRPGYGDDGDRLATQHTRPATVDPENPHEYDEEPDPQAS